MLTKSAPISFPFDLSLCDKVVPPAMNVLTSMIAPCLLGNGTRGAQSFSAAPFSVQRRVARNHGLARNSELKRLF